MVDVSLDRWVKYSHGLPRLLAVLLFLAIQQPAEFGQAKVLCMHEWVLMTVIGGVGALTNTLEDTRTNFVLLSLIAAPTVGAICHRVSSGDLTVLIFLLKTALGDCLAGKIDVPHYTSFFAVSLFVLLLAFLLATISLSGNYFIVHSLMQYQRVFPALFLIQFISEFGDRRFERLLFFRHRYCFELLTVMLCLFLSLGPWPSMSRLEFRVIAADLISCTSYRAFNALLIISVKLSEGETSTVRIALAIGFKLFSFICQEPFMLIKSPELAKDVMSSATSKGRIGFESNIVAPAWRPALSIESVDGDQWRAMRTEFDSLVKILFPSPVKASELMRSIARRNARALIDTGDLIDAQGVAQVTASSLLEAVLGKKWEAEDQVFIDSSWEWRREIACRGKGDLRVKQRAIDRLILLLRRTKSLWDIHGEGWCEAERYSLILQPLLVSPIINCGDVMCAMSLSASSLDIALSKMHPFPLWERSLDEDLLDDRGLILIAKGTHAIMFPSDVCPVVSIFGAGERRCPGVFLAMPLMEEMASAFSMDSEEVPAEGFKPQRGHKYSGRHNDSNMTVVELIYMVKKVVSTVLGVWWWADRSKRH